MTCPPWLHGLSECGEERRAHCGAESSLTCGKHTFMWSTCQDLGSVTRTEFPLRNNCPAWLHSRRLRPFQRGGAKWAIADCRSPQTRFCDRSGPAGNACFCRSSAKARNLPPQQPRGAQPDAVTGRDVRPSNFRDRVFERYGSIPQVKPTDPNRFGSFTAQNGAGAESAMGKGEESSAETKANHVGISPQEDCGGTKGTVGEDTGGEEEIGGGVTSAIRVKRAAMNKKKAQNQPSLSRIGRYPAHMKWLILGLVLMIPVGYWLSTKRRRMSNRIEDEIKKANAFRDQIENLVIAKGQCPTGDRNTPLMAYWSLIQNLLQTFEGQSRIGLP